MSSEKAKFNLTASHLKADFSSNQTDANAKYIEKTIIVTGKVTEKTAESITLDNSIICILSNIENSNINLQSDVKIKGKLDDFDDLFGFNLLRFFNNYSNALIHLSCLNLLLDITKNTYFY